MDLHVTAVEIAFAGRDRCARSVLTIIWMQHVLRGCIAPVGLMSLLQRPITSEQTPGNRSVYSMTSEKQKPGLRPGFNGSGHAAQSLGFL
jgi:hypothetical protein